MGMMMFRFLMSVCGVVLVLVFVGVLIVCSVFEVVVVVEWV